MSMAIARALQALDLEPMNEQEAHLILHVRGKRHNGLDCSLCKAADQEARLSLQDRRNSSHILTTASALIGERGKSDTRHDETIAELTTSLLGLSPARREAVLALLRALRDGLDPAYCRGHLFHLRSLD